MSSQTTNPNLASIAPTLYARPTTILYGLTAVPARLPTHSDATRENATHPPPRFNAVQDFHVPNTALARRIDAYAKRKLPSQTYRHSRRVFAWGCAVARGWFAVAGGDGDADAENMAWGRGLAGNEDGNDEGEGKLVESWFLTAMLHDIGTPEETLKSTRLSYEFWAGFHALQILQDASLTNDGGDGGEADGHGDGEQAEADREQAESVAEAIIRHQDVQDNGMVTLLTRLIHIGTLLDNVGQGREMVSDDTVSSVVAEWPRRSEDEGGAVWTSCFYETVRMEKTEKPYAMVSRIEGFEELIAANGAKGGAFARFE